MRVDLHVHSTASDGALPPEAVVRAASAGGLDVVALADHDTTAGFAPAARIGRELDVQVVAAVEMSSTYRGRDIHVLGYFLDPSAPAIVRHEDRAGRRREERMREMVDRLGAAGIVVAYEAVQAAAGPDGVSIGRPHLASALVEAGYASSTQQAFDALIGDDSDAFVPTHLLDPFEAARVIVEAGGVPIWAHPPSDMIDTLLPGMLDAGLRGLEVYRPRHKRADVLRLESICRSAALLMSGGSDWHGPAAGSALGDFFVAGDEIAALLEAGGM